MSALTEQKQVSQSVTIGHKCDVCGERDITKPYLPEGWLGFNHHHQSWGNDSIDSYEYYDVCGVDCFIKQLESSINELDDRYGSEIAGMPLSFAKKLLEKLKN